MKQGLLSRAFAVGALVAMLVGAFGVMPAQAVVSNTLIKGSGPTVYWYATNGKRYVFPNAKTFYTWFTANDFGRVQTVSDAELSRLPLGGNVTYRPGAKLVKVTTDPRVYAVSRYGTLRWLTSESVATQLYGPNWRYQVEDLPDPYFVNYTTGNPVYGTAEFNASNEYYSVNTPTDNIRDLWTNTYVAPAPVTPYYPYPSYPSGYPNYGTSGDSFNSSTYLAGSVTNRWMSGDQEAITYTATVSNTNTNASNVTIRIIDEHTGNELGRCNNASTCSVTLTSFTNKTISIYSRAVDQRGYAVESSRLSVAYGHTIWNNNSYNNGNYNNNYNNTSFTGSARLEANRSEVVANGSDAVTVTTYIDTVSTNIQNVRVKIYSVRDDSEVGSCTGSWSCTSRALTFTNYGNRNTSAQFYAVLTDQYGRTLSRIYSPLITLRDSTPYYPPQPTFSVTGATASVSLDSSSCGGNVYAFNGTITTNGAGTVRYQWERSDSATSPIETITFNSAGTHTISNSWNLGNSLSYFNGWQRLRILAPNETTSNMATFTNSMTCQY